LPVVAIVMRSTALAPPAPPSVGRASDRKAMMTNRVLGCMAGSPSGTNGELCHCRQSGATVLVGLCVRSLSFDPNHNPVCLHDEKTLPIPTQSDVFRWFTAVHAMTHIDLPCDFLRPLRNARTAMQRK